MMFWILLLPLLAAAQPLNCSNYPKVKNVCSEPGWSTNPNDCMLHVSTGGGTCKDYCTKQGSFCAKAMDNTGTGCTRNVKKHKRQTTAENGCLQNWNDQICVCSASSNQQPSPAPIAAPVATPAPVVVATPAPVAPTTPAPVAPTTPAPVLSVAPECQPFAAAKDMTKICNDPAWGGNGNCLMHVVTRSKTCAAFCTANGSTCQRGMDNDKKVCLPHPNGHNRQTTANNGCDQKWHDQLCSCGPNPAPVTVLASAPPTVTPSFSPTNSPTMPPSAAATDCKQINKLYSVPSVRQSVCQTNNCRWKKGKCVKAKPIKCKKIKTEAACLAEGGRCSIKTKKGKFKKCK